MEISNECDLNVVKWRVVILGGGVAAYTCALYLKNANITPLVLEGGIPGGTLTESQSVRNWPGIEDASGNEIMMKIRQQIAKLGVILKNETVEKVYFESESPFLIMAKDNLTSKYTFYVATCCVIAMGSHARRLGVEGEDDLWGSRVFSCATCDGFQFKNKKVAVVGGGDSSVSYASYLANLASDVYILVRRGEFIAKDKHMLKNVLSKPNVHVLFNTVVVKIEAIPKDEENNNNVKGLTLILQNTENEENGFFCVDGLFLAIGHNPNSQIFKPFVEMDGEDYIEVNHEYQTSIRGVFACGDICTLEKPYRQAITASASGCISSFGVKRFLDEHTTEQDQKQEEFETWVTMQEQKQLKKESLPHLEMMKDQKNFSYSTSSSSSSSSSVVPLVQEIHSVDELKFILQQNPYVLIDFYATWCGPCHIMGNVIDKLAPFYTTSSKKPIRFIKVNVENEKDPLLLDHIFQLLKTYFAAPPNFNVTTLPTLAFFTHQKFTKLFTGASTQTQQEIYKLLEEPSLPFSYKFSK